MWQIYKSQEVETWEGMRTGVQTPALHRFQSSAVHFLGHACVSGNNSTSPQFGLSSCCHLVAVCVRDPGKAEPLLPIPTHTFICRDLGAFSSFSFITQLPFVRVSLALPWDS